MTVITLLAHTDIAKRKPVWVALSNLYLDTEITNTFLKSIAHTIFFESSYSLEEAKKINKYELFPVLYSNILLAPGIWDCFDEEGLHEEIGKGLKRTSWLRTKYIDFLYYFWKTEFDEYWKKIEYYYQIFQANPDIPYTSVD